MSQCQQQFVVRLATEFQRPTHFEIQTVADQNERDVVQRVRVVFAQFIGPDDQRVIQQTAGAARFGSFRQSPGQIGELLGKPLIDAGQLLLGLGIRIRFVRKAVVPFLNAQPARRPSRARTGLEIVTMIAS